MGGGEKMPPTWAQRREDMWSDGLVSPDVFTPMVERLGAFVVPYPQALATEADPHPLHRYLQGLLSHVDRKHAEASAACGAGERQSIQDFIGTVPWEPRPLVTVFVGQGAERLGEPAGIIAFDPRSFPKRGPHAVGVKRQWGGHRGKGDTCQGRVCMGAVSHHAPALRDCRLSLAEAW